MDSAARQWEPYGSHTSGDVLTGFSNVRKYAVLRLFSELFRRNRKKTSKKFVYLKQSL